MGDAKHEVFVPSIDLVQEVAAHWTFLQEVDSYPQLQQHKVLHHALWRYETKWLPLLVDHSKEELDPPLDIHWLWHVHMLSPRSYHKDCESLFGAVPDHKFYRRQDCRLAAQNRARKLWSTKYPDYPFFLDFTLVPHVDVTFKSRLTYDLISASERQYAFFYNVSLLHYTDVKFLETAENRYCKFVSLKKTSPNAFIVPMYDVDLLWHTHQLFPHSYAKDTIAFLGFILNHNDSMTDRSQKSHLNQSDIHTRELWQKTYNGHFHQPGTMYRGGRPHDRLHDLSDTETSSLTAMQCYLKIKQVNVDHPKYGVMIGIKITVSHENDPTLTWGKKFANMKNPLKYLSSEPEGLYMLHVNTRENPLINVYATRRKGGFKGMMGDKVSLGNVICDIDECLKTMSDTVELEFTNVLDEGAVITVKAAATDVRPAALTLRLSMVSAGNFQPAIMPEDVQQLWGPVPLPALPFGVENKCMVAIHKLLDLTGSTVFVVRVVHSLPLQMSAVQIFYKDKMVVVSHLIGPEQLPTINQVECSEHCVTLDNRLGERAMLIKTTGGDWGIVKALWTGMKKGLPPPAEAEKGSPGNPGYLHVEFTELHNEQHCKSLCNILRKEDSKARDRRFTINGVEVNLSSNTIKLPGNKQGNLAENTALVFSALTLLVLCQPRPDVCLTGSVSLTKPKAVYRGGRRVETLDTQNFMMFLYVGWYVDTVSNSWLYWQALHQHTSSAWEGSGDSGGPFCPLNANEDLTDGCDLLSDMNSGVCGGCGGCGTGIEADMAAKAALLGISDGAACGGACSGGCGGCSGGCGGGCGAM